MTFGGGECEVCFTHSLGNRTWPELEEQLIFK